MAGVMAKKNVAVKTEAEVKSIATRSEKLLAIPASFRETALAFPGKVTQALELLKDVEPVVELLNKADALVHYSRRVKADTEIANAVNHGKTKIEKRLGQLLKPMTRQETGKLGGRGKKGPVADAGPFTENTVAKYRKVAKVEDDDLDAYYAKATAAGEEATTGGMLKSVADETREAKREEVVRELSDISSQEARKIAGVYDVIVMDPPWPMEKIERDVAPKQVAFEYPTMTEQELMELEIPAHDNCHVWVWTTHKFLPMAMRLLETWRLKYVCTFVWHKPGGFQPFGLPQYNCEFALYARRGSPIFLETTNFNVCFDAPRGAHSEKPEAFYEVVRRVTGGRRLDMFNRRSIEGFDGWGLEAK